MKIIKNNIINEAGERVHDITLHLTDADLNQLAKSLKAIKSGGLCGRWCANFLEYVLDSAGYRIDKASVYDEVVEGVSHIDDYPKEFKADLDSVTDLDNLRAVVNKWLHELGYRRELDPKYYEMVAAGLASMKGPRAKIVRLLLLLSAKKYFNLK
jgi:hypothetical protein